jgi:peptide/nickel transport system substrate-binding protein
VRRALNLALDRHGGNLMVQKVSAMKNYGIAFPAGADQDISQEEMDKLPGFGTDMVAARAEAKRLLAEAGVPNLHLTLLNRNTGEPYATAGIFMIDQWRQIGVDAVQNLVETAPYFAGLSSGNFDVAMDSNSTVSSDADEVLVKYLPDSSSNFSGGKDPELQSLYDKQALATDPVERKKLIDAFQRRLIDDAFVLPLFRSVNIGALSANFKGWKIMPSPTLNMDMAEVWIQK